MGKRIVSFFIVSILVYFSNCSIPEEGSILQIRFLGKYGSDPLVISREYEYFDGSKISFTKSEFFISNISMEDDMGNWFPVEMKYPVLINLQDHHFKEANAIEGMKINFGEIKPGDYKKIRFGIGVPPELNAKTPKDFPSNNAMGQGDHYWATWDSYIFSKTEGIIKDSNNRTEHFLYHSGFNDVYKVLEFQIDIKVIEDNDFEIKMKLDHRGFFGTSQNFVDIYNNPAIHTGGDFMNTFMNRFHQSISIE